ASVSQERLQQLLQKLSSFKTRNTLSDPAAPNGLGEARQWILDELKRSSPKLQVSFDTHVIPQGGRITKETELRNVLAILPGRSQGTARLPVGEGPRADPRSAPITPP